MKNLLIVIAFFIFASCQETLKPPDDNLGISNLWEVQLENDLGTLNIKLPKHFDTLFKWTEYSDCGDGCAKIDYRIQPKKLPVFKDNGFIYYPLNDSVEQFTIKHAKLPRLWRINDTSLITKLQGRLKSEAAENLTGKFIIDTILQEGNRKIAVIAFNRFDSINKINRKFLNAITAIDGTAIELFFEFRKSYQDTLASQFMISSFDALKSIRITNGR